MPVTVNGPAIGQSGAVSGAGTTRRRAEAARYATAGTLIQAPAWQAATAYKLLQQVTLASGQVVLCSTAGTSGGASPTYSATAPITDNSVTWCPTDKYVGTASGLEVPSITVGNTPPGGYSLTQIVDGTSRTLLPAAFTRFLMPATPYAGAAVGYQGIGMFYNNGSTSKPFGDTNFPAGAACSLTVFETITDDPNPAFNFLVNSTVPARIFVGSPSGYDMVQVDAGGVAMGATNPNYYTITWASGRKLRRYRIEMSNTQNSNLNGYAIGSTSVMYAPRVDALQGIFITDSYGGTTSPSAGFNSDFLAVAALRYAGIRYAQGCGQAGAGYEAGSTSWNGSGTTARIDLLFSNGGFALPSQYSTGVTFDPAVVCFAAGYNDVAGTPANITANALTAFRGARTLWPNAVIIVFGPQNGAHNSSAGALASEAAILSAFNTWADARSAFVPVLNDPAGAWVRGTGFVGATNGTGNSDFYTGADGTHPPIWGAEYMARRYAYWIDTVMASFGA